MSESFTFRGANGQEVFTWYWDVPDKPRGVVQIFHGMAEHAGRYEYFARYLNERGYSVIACDMRGHGKTGELNGNSCDIDNDGFNGIVEDQKLLMDQLMEKHPNVPVFVIAHSFGSFVAQEYIKRYGSLLSGVILSGSCLMKGPSIQLGTIVATASLPFGRKRPNRVADALGFGSYNKNIENPSSKFSWTSRDEEQVKKYEADGFCGNILSVNFYYYLCKGLKNLYKDVARIPRDLPVLLISGDQDPVGLYGKGTRRLYELYWKLGISDLQLKLYPGARHEILNETNRDEVYLDMAAWLIKHT